MGWELFVSSGSDQGTIYKPNSDQIIIVGRGRDTDTVLSDKRASRQHCTISGHGDTIRLKDLGSSSGTFVNGERVDSAVINVGDEIKVGDTVFVVRGDGVQISEDVELDARGLDGLVAGDPELSHKERESPGEDDGSEWIGKTIHRYRLASVIASGTTGVVYKARFEDKAESLALKLFHAELSKSDDDRERFLRGMKTMFPIRHPNIVRILNAGKLEERCWVAMDYIDGESLAKVIERIGIAGMLDWHHAFRVAVHIGRALEKAYEHQIIHRNISPRNILRRQSDKVSILGDLILAKALEGAQVQEITRPGELVGDMAYMSPERTRGTDDVDCRSDLYGLGATCYALMTRRPPIEGHSLPEVINRIRIQVPKPPKEFQLSIADMFEDAILKLLEKRPENRYQTPTHLLDDLERIGKFQGIRID